MDILSKEKPKEDLKKDESEIITQALKRYDEAYSFDRENLENAHEDLRMRAGDQWNPEIKKDFDRAGRPCLTINTLPSFIKQITGDIRQTRPAIKAVPSSNEANNEGAEIRSGLIRYIENRSDAMEAYYRAADDQVTAGIGHCRIETEYSDEQTLNKELRISPLQDGVNVLWDPDSQLATREDAMYCFVPSDISIESFKAKYPNKSVNSVGERHPYGYTGKAQTDWRKEDTVRIVEYWVKEPFQRKIAQSPDGTTLDITSFSSEELAEMQEVVGEEVVIEERKAFKVCRYVLSLTEVLEEKYEWPGRFIPIIPFIGEEVRISGKAVRHGVIRYAKDAQKMYNYMRSAQTEVVLSQPKAPFIGTQKNFQSHLAMWSKANSENLPFLAYTPDPANGNIIPQRVSPAVSSQGFAEGAFQAVDDLKRTIGIYDASLGAQSNETSGKAILARQREGDVGSYVYMDNFIRAIKQVGRILVDLIPYVYDTERVIRIMGEDGKLDTIMINQAQTIDGINTRVANDVTNGAYDIYIDVGPSYSTKRVEAREGMMQFVQSVPQAAAVMPDLIAKAQDWPHADKIAERLRSSLPPHIQAMEAQKNGEELPPAPPPPPEVQIKAKEQELDMQKAQMDLQMKQMDFEMKKMQMAFEARKMEHEAVMANMQALNTNNESA